MSSSSAEKNTFDTTTYEGRRHLHKNSIFAATFLFFKSTIGLGLLVNQYYIGKAGLLWGSFITFFLVIFVGNTLDLMLKIANNIEKKSYKKIKIENFDQISFLVFGKKMQICTKIFIILYNESVLLINTINFAKFLQIQFSGNFPEFKIFENLNYFKLFIIILFLCILIFIVEPEKLKYLSYFATVILVLALLIMWTENIIKYFIIEKTKPYWEYVNFNYTSNLIGNQLYSLESIGTLFTVRSTLKKPKKMRNVLFWTYLLVTSIFIINGTTFLLVN